jgi:transcriptional regulator GlxA family with amidase domain
VAVRRIAIVVYDGVQVLDVTGPAEVFAQAGDLGGDSYAIELVGRGAQASNGLCLGPVTALPDCSGPLDTLLVAGGRGKGAATRDDELIEWIRLAARRSRRVASVCTGAFLLARAGLLDGRRATTHWGWCAQLARRHPAVTVDPDPIYVRDGDVFTSAGVTAGMDLALALVEDDLGAAAALEVARRLVLFARRPGGQSQFSAELAAQAATHAPVRELQGWISEHLRDDLSVGALAQRAHMSPRNFARTFAREVGMTPGAYVEAVRVERARTRLESGNAPLTTIARDCGFGTAETMRRAFHRRVGVAPADYRDRFRTGGGHRADRHPDLREAHRAGRRRAV